MKSDAPCCELKIHARTGERLAGACEPLGTKLGAGLSKSGLRLYSKTREDLPDCSG